MKTFSFIFLISFFLLGGFFYTEAQTPKPDYIIDSVTFDPVTRRVSYLIRNQGLVTAELPSGDSGIHVQHHWRDATGGIPAGADASQWALGTWIPNLAPGATHSVNYGSSPRALPPEGAVAVNVVVDGPGSHVEEENEGNNDWTGAILEAETTGEDLVEIDENVVVEEIEEELREDEEVLPSAPSPPSSSPSNESEISPTPPSLPPSLSSPAEQPAQKRILKFSPKILPGSPLYFFKNAWRETKALFTLDPQKDAILRLQYANEKILEANILTERGNTDSAVNHLKSYVRDLEKINQFTARLEEKNKEAAKKIAERTVENQLKHQILIGKIERKASADQISEVKEVKTKVLDGVVKAMERLDDSQKIERVLIGSLKTNGSPFRSLRNIEILKAVEEKVSAEAKGAILKAEENSLQSFKNNVEVLPTEFKKLLPEYVEKMGGDETNYIKVFDDFKFVGVSKEAEGKTAAAQDKLFERWEKRIEEAGKQDPKLAEEFFKNLKDGDIDDLRALKHISQNVDEKFLPLIAGAEGESMAKFFTKEQTPESLKKELEKRSDITQIKILAELRDFEGKYAELDEKGRYKIKIPFDSSGKKDESSGYIKMAQPYVGSEMGFYYPLPKGTEVILQHVGGDADRPLVTGAFPNSAKETKGKILIDAHKNIVDGIAREAVSVKVPEEKEISLKRIIDDSPQSLEVISKVFDKNEKVRKMLFDASLNYLSENLEHTKNQEKIERARNVFISPEIKKEVLKNKPGFLEELEQKTELGQILERLLERQETLRKFVDELNERLFGQQSKVSNFRQLAALTVNTNTASLEALRKLDKTTSALSKSFERISSGLRINTAADDAAGLAVSEKMRASIRSLEQASRNAQDGISLLQTAEGAYAEIANILVRLRELAVQSANGTLVNSDRQELNTEYKLILAELQRLTRFPGLENLDIMHALDQGISTTQNASAIISIITDDLKNIDSVRENILKKAQGLFSLYEEEEHKLRLVLGEVATYVLKKKVPSSEAFPPPPPTISPVFCTRDYKPVCGQDAKTYLNRCVAELQNKMSIAYDGECKTVFTPPFSPATETCSKDYIPVCGSDNKTYTNKCLAYEAKVGVAYSGECKAASSVPPPTTFACPTDYKPICGINGKTYTNECLLKQAGISFQYYGECKITVPTAAVCPTDYQPVCGNNGKTYTNECLLKQAVIALQYYGECKIETAPPLTTTVCTQEYAPVCGSDSKTYNNSCYAKTAGVSIQYSGECKTTISTPPSTILPQCSDGFDNDKDGYIDLKDIGCSDIQDNDETNAILPPPPPPPSPAPQCSDGLDNDKDGYIDLKDIGCLDSKDDDEYNTVSTPPPPPTSTSQPDYFIYSSVMSPSAPLAGDALSFTAVVKNSGSVGTGSSFARLRLDVGNDGKWDIVTADAFTDALAFAGTEKEYWGLVWKVISGTHKYEVCADASLLITESSEANNCYSATFVVK